ncbi:calcineurin-like phosphoesterase superfamily domain protein [mine drainage metagenome]|uniref:Calcineurin-like phosphoesterase superfamily domain protein n=1 Tax=mine drainage metagenome TaxID=410659 RepID=A0A1J5RMY2_9ZZZZ
MKIAIYSDLHLELLRDQPWQPPRLDVDVVILAGDIGSHTHGLAWAARIFSDWPNAPKVVYVAGNHEYYDAHLGLLSELRKPVWELSGVHLLERNTFEVAGVRILGCTLWSAFDLFGADKADAYMSIAKRSINDYWMIYARGGRHLEPRDTWELHRKAVRWLEAELAKPFEGKTVVVTHFAPHRRCVAPQHKESEVSPYFVTDLAWLMEKYQIDLWCHGHTHTNNDFIAENGCRVVSNQRGYPQEVAAGGTGFREDLVIEL